MYEQRHPYITTPRLDFGQKKPNYYDLYQWILPPLEKRGVLQIIMVKKEPVGKILIRYSAYNARYIRIWRYSCSGFILFTIAW